MLNLFYFNPVHLRFYLGNEIKTTDCAKITNVAVGRSPSHLRVFVTCKSTGGSTIVRFYDRTDNGYNELKTFLTIETDSHPFIADLNGDFLEDVMFTSENGSIKVAFQAVSGGEETIVVRDFDSAIQMAKPESDCIQRSSSSVRLTSPHSVALIDLDGDCMSDLFLTVEDTSSGRRFYEIWLRREVQTVLDLDSSKKSTKVNDDNEFPADKLTGLQSFCLVDRAEIPSGIHSLFEFADIDRDGMVDMVYLKDDRQPMTLYTHYNRLKNQQFAADQRSMTPGLGFSVKNICAPTNRPISELTNIFVTPGQASDMINSDGASTSPLVIR